MIAILRIQDCAWCKVGLRQITQLHLSCFFLLDAPQHHQPPTLKSASLSARKVVEI